jgi:hypothetical protein
LCGEVAFEEAGENRRFGEVGREAVSFGDGCVEGGMGVRQPGRTRVVELRERAGGKARRAVGIARNDARIGSETGTRRSP